MEPVDDFCFGQLENFSAEVDKLLKTPFDDPTREEEGGMRLVFEKPLDLCRETGYGGEAGLELEFEIGNVLTGLDRLSLSEECLASPAPLCT